MNRPTTVKDLIEVLERWASGCFGPAPDASAIALLSRLAEHESKTLEDFAMQLAGATYKTPEKIGALPAADIAERLRRLLLDPAAYSALLAAIRADKGVTKAKLCDVYRKLFQRSGGVRATMPREELLQLLADERLVLDRQGLLAGLTRPAIAAE